MQRLILILLTSFFFLTSCRQSKPDGILSEKTMIDLMTDIHLVDGYLNTLQVDSTRKVIDGLYAEVFKQYAIDSTQFKQNIDYYLGDPIVSQELYQGVTAKLTDYEADYRYADSVKNARINDSVRVVQRYQRLKAAAHKLILDVHIDTTAMNYYTYQNDFMKGAELTAVRTYQPELHVDEPKPSVKDSTLLKQVDTVSSVRPAPQRVEAKRSEN